jgi:hypothetical protein
MAQSSGNRAAGGEEATWPERVIRAIQPTCRSAVGWRIAARRSGVSSSPWPARDSSPPAPSSTGRDDVGRDLFGIRSGVVLVECRFTHPDAVLLHMLRVGEWFGTLDWVAERSSRNYLTSAEIAARIRSFGAGEGGLNGGIVLMHLCTRREDPHVTRLGDLIDSLREDGYRLVTVTDLQRDAAASPALSTLAAARSPAGE